MEVFVHVVGKMKKDYLAQGVWDYSQRISHYLSFSIREVKEYPIREGDGEEGKRRKKKEEGERLLKGVDGESYCIPLHEEGRFLTSKGLATSLKNLQTQGKTKVTFLVGGPFGLSPQVLTAGDFILSLSPMTFPHELARLILVEQLYRACKILSGEPYHY